MQRNRIYLALGLLAACGLGLWLGPRFHRGPLAGSLPELLNYAPPDATLIFYTDAAALRAAPVFAKLAASAPPESIDKDYQEFVRNTGFDFKRDLDRALVAQRPPSADETLVFAEGHFDRAKITQYAQRTGKTESRNGRTEYVLPSINGKKKITLTFLEGNRVGIADGGDILSALPASADAQPAFDDAMRDRLSRVAGSPSFAVIKIPASAIAAGNAAGIGSMFSSLQSMRWVDFAAQTGAQQFVLSIEGECDSAGEADKAKSTIELLRVLAGGILLDPKARGKMSNDGVATISNLLQAARITSEGPRVRLLLSLTPAMIDALQTLAPNTASPNNLPSASPSGRQSAPAAPAAKSR